MASRSREGYILIDRNMCEWQWWQKHNTVIVFMWLLMKAQFHDSTFCGKTIKRGQVATTIANIEQPNKLTRQEVKTAISNLKSTNAITTERCSKFLIITIVNYDEYQNLNIKQPGTQTSRKHHLNIKQPYTNTYNTLNTDKSIKERGRSAPDYPNSIEEIDPERDFEGFPDFDQMPCEADGTKQDIPPRVRKLFYGDYRAYWRYRQQCSTK